MKRSMPQGAQGDLLVEKLKERPKDLEANPMSRDQHGRYVLAIGESSGHVHAVFDPRVVAWSLKNGNSLLEVTDASPEHPVEIVTVIGVDTPYENHTPTIISEPGLYGVVRQQELNPWSEWERTLD
jgi:hypothetical protein